MPFHGFEQAPTDTAGYCKCGLHKSHEEHNESAPVAPAPHVTNGEAVELQNRINNILESCGSFAICKECQAPIYWMFGKGGKKIPFDQEGTVHHTRCMAIRQGRRS